MKEIDDISEDEFNKLNPESIIVTQCIGSDDVLVQSGLEIIESYSDYFKNSGKDIPQEIKLFDAIKWSLTDVSGNSYEILLAKNSVIYEVTMSYYTIMEY